MSEARLDRNAQDGALRVMCVGDIHLGRSPSRLPAELLAEIGRTRTELGPAESWRRTVHQALEHGVAAVLLAGDVVESEEDFFEAYPRLKQGVQQLVDGGVEVVAVAGNHDVSVLPRLAREIPALRLLGQGGRWQSHLIRVAGAPALRVLGWSFPERHVRSSPLDGFPPSWEGRHFADDAPDALPTVVLLHADLDATSSVYAPVSRASLASRPVDACLLGHVHAPDREGLAQRVPLGYLGSIAGLDPGEPGAHGPWLARFDGALARLRQLPLGPLRYERVVLELEALGDVEQLDAALLRRVAELHDELGSSLGDARLVALRLVLRGSRQLSFETLARRLEEIVSRDGHPGFRDTHDDVHYFVEKAVDETRVDRPLRELALGSDPAALFARRLIALEADDEHGRELVQRATAALQGEPRLQHAYLIPVGGAQVERREVRALLIRAARQALEELWTQDVDTQVQESLAPAEGES